MLKDYLHSYLGSNLSSQLGFTVEGGSYDFVVSETLDRLNITSEDDVDVKILRTVGKVELWSAILREISFDYDYSADGVNSKRSQLYQMVEKNLNACILELPENQFTVSDMVHDDPYIYRR